jgi:hypothetical protein
MTTLILKRAAASRPSFMASSLAFGLLLFGTLPTAAQKIYFEAPLGVAPFAPGKGTWTIRKDLTLPTENEPANLPYKELINEGLPGVDQKYLGLGKAYGLQCSPHICAPTFLSLILWFSPKATANLKLIFETTTPLFHALGVGGALTTLVPRDYMLALPKRRETTAQWQHAAELLLAQADVADFSKQIELALFYDAKLILAA